MRIDQVGVLNIFRFIALYINIESTGVDLPLRLVLDITQWVREQGMSGRSFVRLGDNELKGE